MKKKLYFNNIISLFYQVCAVIIGLVLPRLILKQFGSDINGVMTSITQMLSVISMLDLGVGAVVQSALYKPLADKNEKRISEIYSRANKYFTLIVKVLLVYIILLCFYYGVFKNNTFSWIFTTTLILAIAISYFAQYYFGICNTILLNADQKIYIVTLINLFGLITNALATVVMIKIGANIQIVKLVSSCVFLMKPILLQIYVKKHYSIEKIKKPQKDAIPNQWSGLVQHITVGVTNSIDNVILTVFSTFGMISVYSVYVMPLNSIRNLFEVTSSGYKSFFGSLIARDEKRILLHEFNKYETIMHYIITIVMCTTLVTLIPFVLIYTSGVNDANYKDVFFSFMITIAYSMYILRLIYTNLIFAAGKFSETQGYCIAECIINIVISLVLVRPLGLSGVAIGTVASSGYRMVSAAYYLKKDILKRPLKHFIKHIIVDMLCIIIVVYLSRFITINTTNFFEWIVFATISFTLSLLLCSIIHFILYHRQVMNLIKGFMRRMRRR
ncbi:lipopolysaccharide biosynthesis protein [Clostridium perfringens]|uniref:lipopolysaccharide biosynthesis protein n=1 Tax=Clostridium perfringens TaxID=1502 RepID=UPI001A342097|nr:polysaccharide biosynthesis C-terminal domain-containing protein [Clostridium perfringens]MDK0534860.1 polysaccharide biosynthesis C-terminal domain-containing protein [Clostridium perfringens]MDM0943881.1 polysaccharide biosynthesis C-terminal domain-containing protein [Clostridium perfringens]MDU3867631.1 polysaccharide biosynthesis C-terminal domain-containing protein [Clostridium perfringens]MDU7844007.1 polysaccharide biosynthesis C-terminal domain-containing protein [Clostridium perfri